LCSETARWAAITWWHKTAATQLDCIVPLSQLVPLTDMEHGFNKIPLGAFQSGITEPIMTFTVNNF
jgi:hypothetical protein